ncbi:MAG: hypothetical protein IT495_15215 [Gammaproteobacteria bacterium]|nr:hypothetical protein [Gammaproteobacteria bacterium]
MHPFERLLRVQATDLGAQLARIPMPGGVDHDRRLALIAQRFGLNVAQLVCAVGFNADTAPAPRILAALGFAAYEALMGERNYLFINDIYQQLSIDNVVEIYRVLSHGTDADSVADLVVSRLNHIESQIEATINPVMIGSYKLEMRAVYENHLASPELMEMRLRPEYEVLRGIADEIMLMVRSGLMPATALLAHRGVAPEEKRRLLFHDMVTRADVEARLAQPDIPPRERRVLDEALAQPSR